MTDQYDVIGALYERGKLVPVGLAERGTLFAALPDLAGRSVLDAGCGTGFYARMFAARGATKVVGIDASNEMITYARRVEERDPLGITYERFDGAELPVLGSFDVVTAVWLLGYAPGVEALDYMVGRLVANLAPGGTFVVLVPNPEFDWDNADMLSTYGISARRTEESAGRQGYAVHIPGDPPVDFEGFAWPPGVIEPALERAGLTDVRRVPVTITDDLIAEHGEQYWAPLRANPTFAVFAATR